MINDGSADVWQYRTFVWNWY